MGERVEGISNLLWALILSVSSWLIELPVPLLAGYWIILLSSYFYLQDVESKG